MRLMAYPAIVCILLALTASMAQDSTAVQGTDIQAAGNVIGIRFTQPEIDSMTIDLGDQLKSYLSIRRIDIPNSIPPALQFNPVPPGMTFNTKVHRPVFEPSNNLDAPDNLDNLAYATVRDLAGLIRSRKITSLALTRMFISRLKTFDPLLKCMVTLTEERAIERAKKADDEIARGNYRGPLHGIPYGAKDLLAVKGYKTTWGATPYQDQTIDADAAVIRKLDEAGAVLVAKLTLGALAWGDVWFGGMTRNPWNPEEGSSGSSAGSASAVSAGLVPFAIGSETWGSIVSPSTRCGVTGLRPTFGRVSRTGAMALSWSMDKLGPICRDAEDCAVVFDAIRGPDGLDQTTVDPPFNYDAGTDVRQLRIGWLKDDFEADSSNKANDSITVATLRKIGLNLIPMKLPDYPIEALSFILSAEAAAAFDDLTRSGKDDLLERQVRDAWPNVLRAARFIPAVEYIQANRLREIIIRDMATMDFDVFAAPSFGGNTLLLTNLTGHPCVVLPNGFDDKGDPTSITLIGRLYGEANLLAVAKSYQSATGFHKKHPPFFP